MTDVDLEALAARLADTVARLDEYIAAKAAEIAAPRIALAERETRAVTYRLTRAHAADRARWADLEAGRLADEVAKDIQRAADREVLAPLDQAEPAGDLATHYADPDNACDLGRWHTGPCTF